MNCPRCESTLLTERERDGLLVDVCSTCRGVWLDRGELEKLIARATREFDELAGRHDDTPLRGIRRDDDARRYHDDEYRRHPKRKRHWFETFGDIFD